jgi:hypothetical protein
MKMIKNSTLSFGEVHLIQYFILIFVFAIPFWVLGFLVSSGLLAGLGIPTNIPISALMFIVPMSVASILVYKENKINGVKQLLKRAFDYNRTKKHKIWYLPALLLMPIIAVLVYIIMRLIGLPLPTPYIPFLLIPIFLFISLKASIILGLVWAIWHVVPFIQTNNTPSRIVWQFVETVALRVIIVWVFNNSGKSVFMASLVHDTYNTSTSLFPNYGSNYNPQITAIFFIATAIIAVLFWGSKTLAQFKIPHIIKYIHH